MQRPLISQRTVLLVVGVLFHLLYLWSIFDIYFVSPLVHGMQQHRSTPNPPAKRLFLMVGDGQKAETTFSKVHHPEMDEDIFLAPYLRSIIRNEGTYGISHTRMPTESRPGHVAMIAGFYEDVSAVTKGWKENPVDFDSFLNQTSHSYTFGSPDILPMFAKGASDSGKVEMWMYGAEFEDFTHSSIDLDQYVFDHLDSLFQNSTQNSTLSKQIHHDRTVFFLHLLGTDTAGHSYRPYSVEYYDNIRYTDKMIKRLVKQANDFFGDDKPAFIFTADHGMSDFGSHGDGHPNNTRTPFICWGAGCSKPVHINPDENEYLQDPYEADEMRNWYLDDIKRNDLKQADITSLMSYLIGSNYPANSVGELPVEYLDDNIPKKVRGLYVNALSILEQYHVKLSEVLATQLNFKPFPGFELKPIEKYTAEIESLLSKLESDPSLEDETIHTIEQFINTTLEGLDYLQKYNWMLMRTIVTLGFIGWIIYSYTMFLELFVLHTETTVKAKPVKTENSGNGFIHLVALGIYSAVVAVFVIERAPLDNFLYAAFPVFFWDQILVKRTQLISGTAIFFSGMGKLTIGLIFVAILAFFEAVAYGFTHREIFTFMFILLGLYPIILDRKKHQIGLKTIIYWIVLSVCLSYFPSQNPVKTENLQLIVGSGVLMIITGFICFLKCPTMSGYTRNVIFVQLLLIASSIYSVSIATISLQKKEGLPKVAQILNWFNLTFSLIVPYYLHSLHPNRNYKVRYLVIYLVFAPTFLILTISFEALFYVLFALMLIKWIDIENHLRDSGTKWMQLLRVAIIGFFYLQIAFFGTGNVSSISSFSLESVYRLLPIFDPFPMGALLVLKLIIPYILLSISLGLMNVKLHLRIFSISTLLISFSVILSLNFFFMVKTEGSWLDIGLTISNYCLAILSSLFMITLEFTSHLLLHDVVITDVDASLKMTDKGYEDILKEIERDSLQDGSIASRARRRGSGKSKAN
ncbi:MCD4 [Brettanomyces bruxellensis]|uniref:GPI ethanolamine phosphate transferase 1 n=1 Tax=Dekkera bruxellensis TaxID=5007 RepID=A0A7D9H6G3_DEKBR|nr:MCD4 [Brettanomyces bruxellensis]